MKLISLPAIVALVAAGAAIVVQADPVELTTFAALEKPTPTAVLEYGPSRLKP